MFTQFNYDWTEEEVLTAMHDWWTNHESMESRIKVLEVQLAAANERVQILSKSHAEWVNRALIAEAKCSAPNKTS